MTRSGDSPPLPSVVSRIVERLSGDARSARVVEVRIGLGYTAVLLADGGLGLAYTFRAASGGGCSVFRGLRPIAGRPASELLPLLGSSDLIEAGVGLACANALANRVVSGFQEGDVLEQLDLRPGDDVAMVGHFGPLVGPIRSRARSLTVLESDPKPVEGIRPAGEAEAVLRRSHVAIVTATAIINHTIDGLLRAAKGCREVAVVGPSTPMLPEAFEGTGVALLSGVAARHPAEVLRIISEGGGTRQFGPHVRKGSLAVVRVSAQGGPDGG